MYVVQCKQQREHKETGESFQAVLILLVPACLTLSSKSKQSVNVLSI